MLSPGDIVRERYKVVSLIGRGGLSYVYDVEDLKLPKHWALKEFYPRNLEESEIHKIREQFEKEVKILAGLHHPRLPAVSDSFTYNERDYMVMELIEGKTLDLLISERSEPWPESQVREWTLQILEILEYLHSQNPPIIYRDIKPQNIIIMPGVGVRFIDFGIARLFNPVKDQDTIFMGTPGYASPEQFRQRQTDCRSDLYSLGATMHYLLTLKDPGVNPFDFEPVSLSNPSVSPLMEKVVQRALEIKADNRFQTASDMRKVIVGALSIEELFSTAFIILEPRELNFLDLRPGTPHTGELVVKNSAGSSIKVNVTSSHPGLRAEPSQFEAPSEKIKITADHRQFPRGEKVSTTLVISTESSKITLPVSVQYQPTLIRGMSPAFISILFFMIPVVTGILWIGYLQKPESQSPFVSMVLLCFSAIALGAFVPSRLIRKPTLLLYAALIALLIPISGRIENLAKPAFATYINIPLSLLWFIAVSLGINTALFLFSCDLSGRQRNDVKLVIVTSFFIFPALLYIVPVFLPVSNSFIFSGNLTLFLMAALFSFLYAMVFLYSVFLEKKEADCTLTPCRSSAAWSALARVATTAGMALIFSLLWYLTCMRYDGISKSNPLPTPLMAEFCRMTSWLPLYAETLLPGGSFYSIAAVALVVVLFYLLVPRIKFPVRIMLSLLVLGGFINMYMAALSMQSSSVALLKKMLRESPEKIMQELGSLPHGGRKLEKYYSQLYMGKSRVEKREFTNAVANFRSAMGALNEPSTIAGKKLHFMRDQISLWNMNDDDAGLTFEDMDKECAIHRDELSSRRLNYFATENESSDLGRLLWVPKKYFFFITRKAAVPFENDYEVQAAVKFLEGVIKERHGNPAAAQECFRRMVITLESSPETETSRALMQELRVRKEIMKKIPDIRKGAARYIGELAAYYREVDNPNFAIPLFIYQVEHSSSGIFEQASLIETLYGIGAAERGNKLVKSLCDRLAGSSPLADPMNIPEYKYLKAIQDFAMGDYRQSFALLQDLESEPGLRKTGEFYEKLMASAAGIRRWDKIITLSEKTLKKFPGGMKADDYLIRAWSYDITGDFGRAKPLYEKYVNQKSTRDPDAARLALARNRLAGGPIPTYIIFEQIKRNPERYHVVIFGEGVPEEFLPHVIVYHGSREKPALTVSPNIRLEKRNVVTMKNYVKTYYKVRFIDGKKEQSEKSFRFYCSYDFTGAGYYPRDFCGNDIIIFNAKYVKGVPPVKNLPEAETGEGLYLIQKPGQSLVVIPRFSFISSCREPSEKRMSLVDRYHNTLFEEAFPVLNASDLFGLFSREERVRK